jgi:hypothetical protein
MAQTPDVETRPEADSPAGVVYEIPLEQARRDAAPIGAPKEPPGDGRSEIRSENGFGSSSDVPGQQAGSPAAGDSDERRANPDSGAGKARRAPDGELGDAGPLDEVARHASASAEGPSEEIVIPLLTLLVAVGSIIGVIAGRARLRRPAR